jgi:hypothetical protein
VREGGGGVSAAAAAFGWRIAAAPSEYAKTKIFRATLFQTISSFEGARLQPCRKPVTDDGFSHWGNSVFQTTASFLRG